MRGLPLGLAFALRWSAERSRVVKDGIAQTTALSSRQVGMLEKWLSNLGFLWSAVTKAPVWGLGLVRAVVSLRLPAPNFSFVKEDENISFGISG